MENLSVAAEPLDPEREQMQAEAQRIKDEYVRRDRDPRILERYSPFSHVGEAGRIQQLRAMMTLFRKLGRPSFKGMRILDVGCGNGHHLRFFIDLGADPADLVGLDISSERLDYCRRVSPNIRFVQGNGFELPFADKHFDLVFESGVFCNIGLGDMRKKLAREVMRIVAPGGFVFCWDLPSTVPPHNEKIDLDELFPNVPRTTLALGEKPPPGEFIRPFRPTRLWWAFQHVLNYFAYPPIYLAALIGPLHP